MGPLDRELARRRGQRKVDAMKRRTGRLRGRVVAIAAIGFVLLWTVVFVQMATGNDPVLGTGAASRSAVKKKRALERERQSLQATVPPPGEEDDGESAPAQIETEQREAEARELEARELEELEAVSTGQS
jgi:hypothetical protein